MVFQNNVLLGAGGSGTTTYTIDQSIRFNDDDSAYMYRTPSSASDRDKWTWSAWIKKGNSGQNGMLFSAPLGSSGGYLAIQYGSLDQFMLYQWTGSGYDFDVRTTQKFRDPSAWYHYVVVYDSGNAASTERVKLYVNGQRITDLTGASSSPAYPSQNTDSYINNTVQHSIGYYIRPPGSDGLYFDGHMAEIHFLDGYAYDPSYFGEFNNSGIWIPKEYTGSYGTNGFKIDGRDSSDLGDDESGNGNDYTTSGLAAHDQVLDSPTNNFATFNPVMTTDSDFEFSEGNLKLDMNTNKSWYVGAGASMSMSSGKWYWESYWNSGDSYTIWGILDTEQLHTLAGSGSSSIYALNFNGIQPNSSGTNDQYRQGQGGSAIATGQAGAPGGIWQFALDMDNKKMWLGYNGTYVGSGDPANGTNETWSSTYIASDSYTPINQGYQISAHSILTYNFGQDSTFAGATSAGGNSDASGIGNFKYSVPSGFKALCTKNLGS